MNALLNSLLLLNLIKVCSFMSFYNTSGFVLHFLNRLFVGFVVIVAASSSDLWLCIPLFPDWVFWHILCSSFDQNIWCSAGCNRYEQMISSLLLVQNHQVIII